jgi:hypothetical protein
MENKIPKDLSRWLKDSNKYVEFKRLINLCGYRCEDLLYKETDGDYGIKKWLMFPLDGYISWGGYCALSLVVYLAINIILTILLCKGAKSSIARIYKK